MSSYEETCERCGGKLEDATRGMIAAVERSKVQASFQFAQMAKDVCGSCLSTVRSVIDVEPFKPHPPGTVCTCGNCGYCEFCIARKASAT